jgi:hypothetical protein
VEVVMKKFMNNKAPKDRFDSELLINTGSESSKYKNFWDKYGSMKQIQRNGIYISHTLYMRKEMS